MALFLLGFVVLERVNGARAKVNRWVNIIVGIVYAVVLVLVNLVPGETWAYYAFYEILEAVFIALIVWHAWKWPKQEG